VLPDRPEDTPIPEPAPSREAGVQSTPLPVIEVKPLPEPKAESSGNLFEDIRRKLFGGDARQ
jgi:F420-0:gamma-glutamyl ligase-like protein